MLTAIGRLLSKLFPPRACGPARVSAEDGKPSVRKLRISFPDTLTDEPNSVTHGLTQNLIFVFPQHVRRERIQIGILGIVKPLSVNRLAGLAIKKKLRKPHW